MLAILLFGNILTHVTEASELDQAMLDLNGCRSIFEDAKRLQYFDRASANLFSALDEPASDECKIEDWTYQEPADLGLEPAAET